LKPQGGAKRKRKGVEKRDKEKDSQCRLCVWGGVAKLPVDVNQ